MCECALDLPFAVPPMGGQQEGSPLCAGRRSGLLMLGPGRLVMVGCVPATALDARWLVHGCGR